MSQQTLLPTSSILALLLPARNCRGPNLATSTCSNLVLEDLEPPGGRNRLSALAVKTICRDEEIWHFFSPPLRVDQRLRYNIMAPRDVALMRGALVSVGTST